MTTNQPQMLTDERIFLEALHAVGPIGGRSAEEWAGTVATTADTILSTWKTWYRKQASIVDRFTGTGTVVSCEENPVSEGGRALNFYKVVIRGDAGSRPDQMWIDKTVPGATEMFAAAQALQGQHCRYTKLQIQEWNGDEPAVNAEGRPITRPRLGAISPAGETPVAEPGPTPAPAAAAQPKSQPAAPAAAAPAAEQPPAASAMSVEQLVALRPQSATQLVELAQQHFGKTPQQVKTFVESVLGPKKEGQLTRSAADLLRAWTALCYAETSADAA